MRNILKLLSVENTADFSMPFSGALRILVLISSAVKRRLYNINNFAYNSGDIKLNSDDP